MNRTTVPLRTFADCRAQPNYCTSVPHEFDSWLCYPRLAINRDSDLLPTSNWSALLARLEKKCGAGCEWPDEDELASWKTNGWVVLHDSHWACGWVETLWVRPGSLAHLELLDIMAEYERYPVLDEEDYLSREHDAGISYISDELHHLRDEYLEKPTSDAELAGAVFSWIGNSEQFEHEAESQDDRGAAPSAEAIIAALIDLGFLPADYED